MKIYQKNIDYQFYCHILGETTLNSQEEWDIELQRMQNNYGLIGEIKYQCNATDWDDNKLLFHPDVKFYSQLPYPNQWISYQKNDKPIYYYVGEDYVGVTGWKFIDAWYYFNDFAVMQTGWLKYNNYWYFLQDNGAMATGWKDIGESRYYFKTSGKMLTGVHVIGEVEYEFNSRGHLIRTGKKVNINPCDKYTCIYPYEDPTTVEEGER